MRPRVWPKHPGADWVGIDASQKMLAQARERLPDADLRLPAGASCSATLSYRPPGSAGRSDIDGVMDVPDSVEDQLSWLRPAGFEAEASSVRADLAVFEAERV